MIKRIYVFPEMTGKVETVEKIFPKGKIKQKSSEKLAVKSAKQSMRANGKGKKLDQEKGIGTIAKHLKLGFIATLDHKMSNQELSTVGMRLLTKKETHI